MSSRPFTDRPLLSPLVPLGLVVGALGFTLALTPSLIPRTGLLQGAVAGLAFACVYGLMAGLASLWAWLGLPDRAPRWFVWGARAVALAIVLYGLAHATGWQNSVHQAVGMAPVESARPFTIAGVSLGVVLILLAIGRIFRRAAVIVANRLARVVPERVALLGGFVAAALLFWSVGSGVLLENALQGMDRIYQRIDALIPADLEAPTDPLKSGSSASLLQWQGLGAAGRDRVVAYPDAATITQVSGAPAMEPLRVYVGLNSAETAEERADLALAELIRIGAFQRQMLVIATPTGTGWIDPASMTPLEFLTHGNIASVSVQYSYLPSWLSLIVQPEYGHEQARAVFRRVYDYWRNLPKDTRPRLYLHGLSLGSLNSDISLDMFDVVGDPPQGAFWVGPPFASRTWPQVTRARNEGTPAWSPKFRDGSLIRFTTQENTLDQATAPWGAMRIIYLQYPSDAIVFFEPDSLWRMPDWMKAPRGPDVSPALTWVPVVTFVQLLTDMMTATMTPAGHGHVYAARDYLSGWIGLTDPQGWDAAALQRLNDWLTEKGI